MREYIGIFDSGIGGLTVAKEVFQLLPYEDVVYLGDTARLPYGSKSPETVRRFALQCLSFLSKFKLKLIVVACNTVSSNALDILKDETEVPIIDVIKPGVDAAIESTKTGCIAVIGTKATILSNSYINLIYSINKDIIVYQQACPLFVPIVEEGWQNDDIALTVAHRYLEYLLDKNIDTVVLGCTHYPLLKGALKKVFGKGVNLIDSAYQTGLAVRNLLKSKGILKDKGESKPERLFFVTDIPNDFQKIATNFLDCSKIDIEKVDITGE
ncbi:MAG: glutamate racemase [bacterium]